ncbi:hypothetical protein COO91_11214 (plasmid) [Nostoc flagelliforme CCNUN1]|uniref:Uncharacterized protein n=1 Tax=Nostoc flagelliforme CCNUN1 TaxID=2038116 RepID=A0A2K8T7C9_9NOSO|nr:hypothetical protein COO91_09775 [Nostoc flagelliforme CCNUN1]AUB44959.1 hypothetical protein COO91_11214 [Nostoc flagelliforme CCNUN1]
MYPSGSIIQLRPQWEQREKVRSGFGSQLHPLYSQQNLLF